MAWGKVDDKLHSSVKWRRATKGARALWATALSWCSDQENDGKVPADMLKVLDGTPADAASLVSVTLWDEMEGGWVFRNWHEYNPDSASTKAVREAKSEGGKEGNHYRWHVKRQVKVPSCDLCQPDNPSDKPSDADRIPESGANRPGANPPDPTRPDPTHAQNKDTAASAAEFEEFWAVYDKKSGKRPAEQKWKAALRKPGVTPDALIAAARTYVEAKKRTGEHPQYTKNAATWLNGEHWNDDVPTLSLASNGRPAGAVPGFNPDAWMQNT